MEVTIINVGLTGQRHSLSTLNNKEIGFLGESITAACLINKGYKILGRNVKTRFGEIDLVARKGREIFFVEVKTRRQDLFGWPEEAVTPQKMVHLKRSCLAILPKYVQNGNWSIMVVPIFLEIARKRAKIRCIKLDP